MATQIIGSIRCTPATLAPGESFLVEVLDPFGKAYGNTQAAYISINGTPGSSQYLQYAQPGIKTLFVTALSAGVTENQTTTVTVQAPVVPAAPAAGPSQTLAAVTPANQWTTVGLPMLTLNRKPHARHTAIISIGTSELLDKANVGVGNHLAGIPQIVVPAAASSSRPAHNVPGPGYLWNFGDGTGDISTDAPFIEHDFEPALNFKDEYQQFHVKVTSEGKTVTRTLTVYNSYLGIKNRFGMLVPAVDSDVPARKFKDEYVSTMTVHNRDNEDITLTQRRYLAIARDKDAVATYKDPIEKLLTPIVIKANTSITLTVQVPSAAIPADSVAYTVYYSGASASNLPVRVGGHFDIDARDQHYTASPILASVLNAASKAKNPVSPATLSNLRHVLTTPKSLADIKSSPIAAKVQLDMGIQFESLIPTVSAAAVSPPPVDGQVCDPDNLPDNIPANMVCQATAETQQVPTAGRFMNARKGDIILDPGGNGVIGGLLMVASPYQLWSHSGLMTQNNNQITHCTASQDRMMSSTFYIGKFLGQSLPSDGVRPDIIKYGWPGVITQTVENAVGGAQQGPATYEYFQDPEDSNVQWPICSFSTQPQEIESNNQWLLVQTMVVTADPMLETIAMREKMHDVADDAAANTGKGHYRFYGYTDPTIGQNTVAPAGTGSDWATGTFPAVCASFIWLMMKKNGIHLQSLNATVSQSDLTSQEIAHSAAVGPNTPDGLYLYTAAIRQSAAAWLYNSFYSMVMAQLQLKVGSFGADVVQGLTKCATHVSNEILNSFADDNTQLDDDSTTWKQTGDANAVSPLDLTFWQGADKFGGAFGFYGYAEPVVYRPQRIDNVTVYNWKTVTLKGALKGNVTFNNAPISGAYIELNEDLFAHSDANGNYEIDNVPYGTYTVTAQVAENGLFLGASPSVNVNAINVICNIVMGLPPDLYRNIVITGTMRIQHTGSKILGINKQTQTQTFPIDLQLSVGPYSTHLQQQVSNSLGSSTASLTVTADWQPDKSVVVNATFKQDTQGLTKPAFIVPEDGSYSLQNWSATTDHSVLGSLNDDMAVISFIAQNNIQEN